MRYNNTYFNNISLTFIDSLEKFPSINSLSGATKVQGYR